MDEVGTLGIVISRHPLELFRQRIQRIVSSRGLSPFIRSVDIAGYRGQKIWIAGILVTGKEVATKKQQPMIFVSFEDELAVYETVLFPGSFVRFHPLLDDGWAFLVFGRVEDDLGALSISVEKLLLVSRRNGDQKGSGGKSDVAGTVPTPERPPVFTWLRDHASLKTTSTASVSSRPAHR